MTIARQSPPITGRRRQREREAEAQEAAAPPVQYRPVLDHPRVGQFRQFLDTRAGRIVLVVVAALMLPLGPLGIFSIFAVTYVFRRPLRRLVGKLPLGPRTTLGLLIVLAGLLRYVFTWIPEYIQGTASPALPHPQLIPGLLIALGLYLAWAIGWGLALVWYRYRLAEALLIQGVFGILIEDFTRYLFAGIATLPLGVAYWLIAFTISASTLGVAWVLTGDKLATLSHRDAEGTFRYVVPPLLIGGFLALIFSVWGRLIDSWGVLDNPAPIRERPFW